jgi:hypothetical protein
MESKELAALLLVVFVGVSALMVAGSLTLRQYFLTQGAQQVQHSLRHLCQANAKFC